MLFISTQIVAGSMRHVMQNHSILRKAVVYDAESWAQEKPYVLPRPNSFLYLPRTKTPGSSAGARIIHL